MNGNTHTMLDTSKIASSEIPEASRPRVSVVVVTYRSTAELPGCIASILSQSLPLEVLLIDNASPDDTPAMVRDFAAKFSNIYAILNTENIGLAAGNNCALGKCRGDYVLILNPDTVMPEGSLARMVEYLDTNLSVGVVGPKNLSEDGTPHISYGHTWGFLGVFIWRIVPNRIARMFGDRFSSYKLQDVMYISGSCLLIRRSIFEQIGGYDPEYFLCVEDIVDLCIRVKQTGSRIVYYPEAHVCHFTGRSGSQVPYIGVWQGSRCAVYHFLKHRGRVQALLMSLLLITSAAVRVLLAAPAAIFLPRYRTTARIYTKVLWNLIVDNPMREHRRHFA